MENDTNSTDANVFAVLNVGGLHNRDKISDSWLD